MLRKRHTMHSYMNPQRSYFMRCRCCTFIFLMRGIFLVCFSFVVNSIRQQDWIRVCMDSAVKEPAPMMPDHDAIESEKRVLNMIWLSGGWKIVHRTETFSFSFYSETVNPVDWGKEKLLSMWIDRNNISGSGSRETRKYLRNNKKI